jgi:transcriptional regulator with XRE-family HTH domain
VLTQDDIRRRIRAAMALAGFTSWDQLAENTDLSRSTVKDLGTSRGRARESHLRVIAAACGLPYAWFTVPDIGAAIAREDEDASVLERLEAVERQVAALLRRDRERERDAS